MMHSSVRFRWGRLTLKRASMVYHAKCCRCRSNAMGVERERESPPKSGSVWASSLDFGSLVGSLENMPRLPCMANLTAVGLLKEIGPSRSSKVAQFDRAPMTSY